MSNKHIYPTTTNTTCSIGSGLGVWCDVWKGRGGGVITVSPTRTSTYSFLRPPKLIGSRSPAQFAPFHLRRIHVETKSHDKIQDNKLETPLNKLP